VSRVRCYPLLSALVAILAAGVAFVTAGMYASAQTPPPSQTAQHRGNRVVGTIQSVSGDSLVVTTRDGKTLTVHSAANTKVFTESAAHLSDIKAGDMVRVLAAKEQDGSLAAVTVQDVPAGLALGGRGGAAGSPRAGANGNGANSNRVFVAGSVVSLNGTSMSVASRDGTSTTVVIPASARISQMRAVPWTSLAAGARVSALGTLNSDGSLSAATIMVMTRTR
jgi:Cu/Ag efflux protein CusF